MSRSEELRVTIATIKFRAPEGWRPRTMTARYALIHRAKDAAKVQEEIESQAEGVKVGIEGRKRGLVLTYTIRKEQIPVDLVTVVGDDFEKKEG